MDDENMILNENSIKEDFLQNNSKKPISKWLNLKLLLLNKKSLESSVNLLKQKTLNKFISNYCEIYKYKLEMYLFSKESNKIMFESEYNPNFNNDIEISDNSKEFCYDSCLNDFLFYFRENNSELLKIIDLLPEKEKINFSYFLCNLFYDNFINPREGQNELYLILYSLLEKEIKELLSPTEENFLNHSFTDYFLSSFLHRDEIKKYLDMVLISQIENINEKCFDYHSMDIIGLSRTHYIENIRYNHIYTFFNMEKQKFYENETFDNRKTSSSFLNQDSFVVLEKNKDDKINIDKDILIKSRVISYESKTINNILLAEFFKEFNITEIKKLLLNEKDEIMRGFYINQLKKCKKDKNAFNCRDYYYEKMAKEKLISRISIENYNKGYQLIIQFIEGFLTNLENKIIIPHSIKIVCKIIYLLFKKKFPRITEFQLYILIGNFLFDKLFNPIFENVECINTNEKDLISFDTRKSLLDIAFVFKKLIRGELFTNKNYGNYNIFNRFIFENFHRIKKIIDNFIDIRIPKKILLLIENYNSERSPEQINYNNPKSLKMDFIIQKCICFNVNHLLLFYNIVNNNKNIFIKKGTNFENIFNELSKYIPQMEQNNQKYYVIVKEESSDEIKYLFDKEKKKSYKKNDILNRLKSHIIILLNDIYIRNNWSCLNYLNTKQTFNFINQYLIAKEKRNNFFPLNWYSKYILQNLDLIEEKYCKDDYNLLFNEIVKDVMKLMIKLKYLSSFLSIHINKKFIDIERQKYAYKRQYETIRSNILKLKALLFIENEKIDLCFMDGKKYNEFQKIMNKSHDKKENKDTLILSEISSCPHTKLKDEKHEKLITNEELLHIHIHTIKDFAFKFSSYYELISEEIMNNSINQSTDGRISNAMTMGKELNNNILFINTSRGVLTTFMNYIGKLIQISSILSNFQSKDEREQISKFILDYILKILCIKIYEQNPLLLDDAFHQKCSVLRTIVVPSNFQIPEELWDESVIKDIIHYLNKIEDHRTPSAMYDEIGNMINSISSMFIFYCNQKEIDFDEILNMIIYCLILTRPKRMIFTIYFCKFFLMKDDINGNLGFNISQIESAIKFINKINAKFLNISEKEFNQKCLEFKF